MNEKLTLALVQQHATANVNENIERGLRACEIAAQNGARLVVFAELAFTPFYPRLPAGNAIQRLAETIPGPITDHFIHLAQQYRIVVIINLFELAGDQTYDSSPVIDADGTLLGVTRMVHIFEAPGFYEQQYYAAGDCGAPVYHSAVGKIGVAICYDRHFPEYMRGLALAGAELVVVPQAGTVGEWPPGLFEAELQVAGFQNGYFTALCNRVGREEELEFDGRSFVTAPDGRILSQAPAGEDFILYSKIDLREVSSSNARRHFIPDRRPQIYNGWLG